MPIRELDIAGIDGRRGQLALLQQSGPWSLDRDARTPVAGRRIDTDHRVVLQ
ncbi:hypothetical protein QNA23_20485 [Rhodococcus erythropolis]|uniref:hypothetical protein n=1 Tax=Rhodococcus erythropolis TaxID=1833 RepID=UPI0024BAF956|nr:hypothetical protein [Rhodococcus erythropolis]MDJ0405883.1 hypothetical protein [Rhodococcus erythropolis]